ncbi:MAG: CoA transferase [Acidimicrobiales bacterium]|jgi:crotonobetainyl-CoA:carnitine CoA-transferase CaiB-like acyl-CoA transferase
MRGDGVAALLRSVGLEIDPAVEWAVEGSDPVLATPLAVGEAAGIAIAAGGVAAAAVHAVRTGVAQRVTTSVERAATSLLSFLYLRVESDGTQVAPGVERRVPVAVGLFRCRDGRFIHLHGSFPSLLERTLAVLGCEADLSAITAAVGSWDAQELEDTLAEAGTCGALVRSCEEWRAHRQGVELAATSVVELRRVGEAPPETPPPGSTPLEGIRVLDLTRVLAGPACGRSLAQHGADVLLVNSPGLPNVEPFVMDTSHGKHSAFCDLDQPEGTARLRELLGGADVFVNGYRSGALARRGFGPEEAVALRPGLVYVSINCYGHSGPFETRPGWEQLAQSVTGMAQLQGSPDGPALVPAAACDYTTGYLAAAGVMAALARRAVEGGSWHVRVSLARTGMWIEQMGRRNRAEATGVANTSAWMLSSATPFGQLHHLAPPLEMSVTPPAWARVSVPLGTDPAGWW